MRAMDNRFLICRPEAVTSRASLADGAAIAVKLLHLGPAMPTAFETDLASMPFLSTAMGRATARTVITGVIDDTMGFANERFRRSAI